MAKIAVIGNEEFTLGFEVVGIDAYPIKDFEKLLSKGEDVAIIVISKRDYDELSMKLKNTITRLVKPIVVILSEDDLKGGDLRNQIIKSLGVDLLKDK